MTIFSTWSGEVTYDRRAGEVVGDFLSGGEDSISEAVGGRTSIGTVELNTKISVGTTLDKMKQLT